MLVADILRTKGSDVATAKADESLQDIAGLLVSKRIGALVIVDESGRLSGIVSERDVVRVIALDGPDALADPVSRVMTRKVVTCTEQDSIDSLMQRMTDGKFRHFPVMRDGQLAGIVSIGDIVKYRIEAVEEEARTLRDYIASG